MRHDGFVHLVAAHAHGAGIDDARQGDDGHFRGTAADVHHHVGGRLLDGQVGADGGGHGLLDEVDLTGTGGLGRVFMDDTDLLDVYDPDLIFKGMAKIHARNV